MAKSKNLKRWYKKTYTTDELGDELRPDITLKTVWDLMQHGVDVYLILGGDADSVIRERVFEEIAAENGLQYDDVYNVWLEPASKAHDQREHLAALEKKANEPVTQAEALETIFKALPKQEHHSRGIKDIWGVAWLDELARILASCESHAFKTNTCTFYFNDGSSLEAQDVKQQNGPARFSVTH